MVETHWWKQLYDWELMMMTWRRGVLLIHITVCSLKSSSFSALILLVGRQEGHPSCKSSLHQFPWVYFWGPTQAGVTLPGVSVSSRVVEDQRTWPQVHARLHGLVTPPRVHRSSFQAASRCSPRSLVEDGHVLLCHELAGIAHRYWRVENISFAACDWQLCFLGHVLHHTHMPGVILKNEPVKQKLFIQI